MIDDPFAAALAASAKELNSAHEKSAELAELAEVTEAPELVEVVEVVVASEVEQVHVNTDVSDICYGEHYHQKETTQEYMKIKNVVRRRYNNFNISLDVSPIERPLKTININPVNEQDDVVITDDYTYPTKEQKKRAKIFYHAFKTGKFTVEDGGSYKYVLPDEYYVSVSGDGELNIVLTMNPQQKMYFETSIGEFLPF
jgi:hypothetical protein